MSSKVVDESQSINSDDMDKKKNDYVININEDDDDKIERANEREDGRRIIKITNAMIIGQMIIDDDENNDNVDKELYSYQSFKAFQVHLKDTSYRWFFLMAGLLSPHLFRMSLVLTLFVYAQRIGIVLFMVFFLSMKFGVVFTEYSWLVLQKNYPFTVINYCLWEMRWILTYFLAIFFLSRQGFEKFLNGIELPIERWRRYARRMKYYALVVALFLVIIPCADILIDINCFNTKPSTKLVGSFFISVCFILFRMLVLPAFCMLSVILYLLCEHIQVTGRRICVQRTIGDAERLVYKLRQFIRKTENSLSLMVFVHMLLVFSSSFTSLMSTIERLEFNYNTHNKTQPTMMNLDFNYKHLPLTDLIETKNQLIKSKSLLKSIENRQNKEVIKATDLHHAYSMITKLQENQMHLMENLAKSSSSNFSATFSNEKPPFYNIVVTITDSYKEIRVMLDAFFTMLEIFLLYMSPIFLIARTDTRMREIVDMVLEIDVDEQQESYALKTYPLKDRLLDLLKESRGLRVFGYQVQFFKTLILGSLGVFVAIALRAVWKHFGFF